MNFDVALLGSAMGLSATVFAISLTKLKTSGSYSIVILSLTNIIWSLCSLLFHFNLLHTSALFLVSISYFCSTTAATCLLLFALIYTNRSNIINALLIGLLSILPVFTQLLLWLKTTRDLLFVENTLPDPEISAYTGAWSRLNEMYAYTLIVIGLILLLDTFNRKPRKFLKQSGAILAVSFIPLILKLLETTRFTTRLTSLYDIVGYSIMAAGFAYGIYREKLIDFMPVTREAVVETMEDGWMILDSRSNIIDINPAAEKITGLTRNKVYGQSVNQVLTDWRGLENTSKATTELEMRRSVKTGNEWRYVNIRISKLQDKHQQLFGNLIVWRDITDTKLREDARQRARDEMFVLLNAISSAASHAMNLEDFLSETIYQIIYPFSSQAVLIFLYDETTNQSNRKILTLVSHFGIPLEAADSMSVIDPSSDMISWVQQSKSPLVIDNIENDPRMPIGMRNINFGSLIILPLMARGEEEIKALGYICLGRKEKTSYSQDEINRLTIISDQIATLIDSDRRRQLSIALNERQRLLRDLHDSVSQKLYGVVATTEAAQAAIEAGSKIEPDQVLAKIGENARQAVKEMRLFLYEMQPVDLENDGLVSILHHRLSAVEGRADVKARLLADDDISLAKDKEIALYFIAQEALNNVLKHAHAKTVTVSLKQKGRNTLLEIIDDGLGFDPQKIDSGGMGLPNMKERAAQINAKLKITSKPGSGTNILVTISKDSRQFPQHRNGQKS